MDIDLGRSLEQQVSLPYSLPSLASCGSSLLLSWTLPLQDSSNVGDPGKTSKTSLSSPRMLSPMSAASDASRSPLYLNAVLLPALSVPALLLSLPALAWHLTQRNIAASSLMLWIILHILFNIINPLIWPSDNTESWWNGAGLCDVEVRLLVGSVVGIPGAIACIMQKLATVMDTNNIVVIPSRSQRIREGIMEALWCWGFPALLMLVYYAVQPIRYFIFGISGCVVAYDTSWPSIVLSVMWGPIVCLVAVYYASESLRCAQQPCLTAAVLLIWRLHCYRREFSRLIAARNTTKSRFLRLFLMSLLLVVGILPYSGFVLYQNAIHMKESYSWERVHGPGWNSIIKVPSYGVARYDLWGKAATGYLAFLFFGTGTDAGRMYKRALLSVGLGKVFPRLHKDGSVVSGPSSFIGSWSSASNKAKAFFSGTRSQTDSVSGHERLGATEDPEAL